VGFCVDFEELRQSRASSNQMKRTTKVRALFFVYIPKKQ